MQVREIMTVYPACCSADDSIEKAADMMQRNDCGCIPVVDMSKTHNSVVGVITDRDIAIRGVALGRPASTPVRELMTSKPHCCSPSDSVEAIGKIMADWQLRRIVVVDAQGHCLGMVAQADLARATDNNPARGEVELAKVLARISEAPSMVH